MKYASALYLLLNSIVLCSQTHYDPYVLNQDNILYIDLVYEDESYAKKDLFQKSLKWIAKAFVDGKEVEVYSDVEEGTVVGKGTARPIAGTLDVLSGSTDYLHYTIQVFCKEGKARIVIDNIGIQTFGNEYVKSSEITPLEYMYWNYGKVNKKKRKGFKKMKKRRLNSILAVIESWKLGMIEARDAEYSDFD